MEVKILTPHFFPFLGKRLLWALSSLMLVNLLALGSEAAPLRVDLPQLLERAEKNPLIQRDFDALRRSAASKLAQAESLRWVTTLNLTATTGVVPDAEFNPRDLTDFRSGDFENDFDLGELGGFFRLQVDALQPIYTFGKITGSIDMAKQGVRIADLEKVKQIQMVRRLVKRAAYTLQFGQESIEILKEMDEKLGQAAEKVEELLAKNEDNVSEVDRNKIRVFQADVRNRKIDAERAERLSISALTELSGLSEPWEMSDGGLRPETVTGISRDQILELAVRAKPEVAQLERLVQLKQHELEVVRSDLFPNFFLGGRFNYGVAPGRDNAKNPYLKDDFNLLDMGVVLGFKQDLGFYRTFQKMEGVEAERDRLKAQLAQLKSKVKLDTERYFEEAVSAQSSIEINEDGLRAARGWLTSSALAFNLGTAETKEILESFAAYFKARVDLIRSIYALNIALSDLSEVTAAEVVDRLKNTEASSTLPPKQASDGSSGTEMSNSP